MPNMLSQCHWLTRLSSITQNDAREAVDKSICFNTKYLTQKRFLPCQFLQLFLLINIIVHGSWEICISQLRPLNHHILSFPICLCLFFSYFPLSLSSILALTPQAKSWARATLCILYCIHGQMNTLILTPNLLQ